MTCCSSISWPRGRSNVSVSSPNVTVYRSRTGEGTKLHSAARHHVLAFEVDDFDDEVRHGWSVLVTGPSEEITDPDDIHAARNLLSGTWVPADRYHVLTIVPERMTGRRITERD